MIYFKIVVLVSRDLKPMAANLARMFRPTNRSKELNLGNYRISPDCETNVKYNNLASRGVCDHYKNI